MHIAGIGMKSDREEGLGIFLRGANMCDPYCQYFFGCCYFWGQGTIANLKIAFVFYQESAKAKTLVAMNRLGYCYEHGHGVEQDEKEAIRWYQKAAYAGNSDSMNDLGYFYWDKQDMKEAFEW